VIGVVLAAHGPLPAALMESLGMILGEMEQVVTLSLMPGDSLEGLIERMRQSIQQVDTGQGVLVFLDLFGGTPSNAAALLTQEMQGVYAVTGVNFPMLAEVFMLRMSSDDLQELVSTAVSAGKSGIIDVVEAFKQFRSGA
jgi:mannose/fructose/sorbose-specific phosphotransferase system IIA component